MQGALANGMPVGIYATYAKAAKPSGGVDNSFNPGGTADKSAFNIAAEVGVIPEVATVGFGIRMGKSGFAVGSAANATDNAILLEGSYKLQQNMLLNLYYTSQSGDAWPSGSTGNKQTTINLATIF